jgi:hypothetical protein
VKLLLAEPRCDLLLHPVEVRKQFLAVSSEGTAAMKH